MFSEIALGGTGKGIAPGELEVGAIYCRMSGDVRLWTIRGERLSLLHDDKGCAI